MHFNYGFLENGINENFPGIHHLKSPPLLQAYVSAPLLLLVTI
jgi:hypothetical protein